MMNTIKLVEEIKDYFLMFQLSIRFDNNLDDFAINKKSQGFCAKLLNLLFNYKLENMDLIRKDYPAIDLGDYTSNIAIQVTSQTDTTKITETIDKFVNINDFKNGTLTKLFFLILNPISWSNTQIKNIEKKYKMYNLEFDYSTNIVTFETLIKRINFIKDEQEKLMELRLILSSEFGENISNPKKNYDLKTLYQFESVLNEDTLINFYNALYNSTKCKLI